MKNREPGKTRKQSVPKNREQAVTKFGGHMRRLFAALLALALTAPVLVLPVSSEAVDRTLPMQFTLYRQGPADSCGSHCRLFVAADGSITADTPADFAAFAKIHEIKGALVVLDSNGGSVHGAIELGRQMRAVGLDTTVGRVIGLGGHAPGLPRARLSNRADCESMCAFVLLAGVHRTVPPGARVMVHQIWLGDRRDDPTAANYSAEDLVLVQRDIGRLARYTHDMGASIEVLDLALRIPPWEPMHTLTQVEIRQTRVATADSPGSDSVKVASTGKAAPQSRRTTLHTTGGLQATEISERHWAMIDHAGVATLARSQPLTVEGDEIGNFDVMVSCGLNGNYELSYVERRHEIAHRPLPKALHGVRVAAGNTATDLKLVSSRRNSTQSELITYAVAPVPAKVIDAFAAVGDRSMMLQTRSTDLITGIRVGNTGAHESLPRLAATCSKGLGDRADLSLDQTGSAPK